MAEQHHDPIQYREPPFHVTLWRVAATGTALLLLYSMGAHVVRMGAMLGGQRMADTTRQLGEVAPGEVGVSVSIPVAGEVADPILGCIVLGILLYLVLTWVCEQDWVKEKVRFKLCFKGRKWWNPWHWVKTLFCLILKFFIWVLQWICGWKDILVPVLIVICIIVVLVVTL